MKSLNIKLTILAIVVIYILGVKSLNSQHVEVQGELKVTQMNTNENTDDLVIHNPDGTLGTRTVASLPVPPPPIDTIRNLASDFELAKHLCDCPDLPPFMIKNLLDSGYTEEDLIASGIPVQDVIDAQRNGILIDTRDNKSYKTVQIGTQTWMAENLNIGTRIDGVATQSDNDIIEKHCYDDDINNCNTYGGIYLWDEMMQYVTTSGTQGICPTGWHLPTDEEWKTLEMQLGMTQTQADGSGFRGTDQGSQLAGNESLWTDGNLDQSGVFESSGFGVLPGGIRLANGSFDSQSISAFFWSSTTVVSGYPWGRFLRNNNILINRLAESKSFSYSVRCMKD